MRREFRKGDDLFRQGSAGDYVLRIVVGEVEILREIGGSHVVLGHARGGELLGEMAVIENREHSATARATTDGVVEILTARQFLDQISSDRALARDVILRLSLRLRRTNDTLAAGVLMNDLTTTVGGDAPSDSGVADNASIQLMAKTGALRARIGASAIPVLQLPFVVGRVPIDGEEPTSMHPDLLIEDDVPFRLSRRHFMISWNGEHVQISDLGSTLGTIVNGRAIGHPFMRDVAPLFVGENDVLAGGLGSPFEFVVSVSR